MNLPAIQPSSSPAPAPAPPSSDSFLVKGECCNCGWKDRLLFHRVVVRGEDRRVCTSCVLRLHPSSFCPYCFEFYEHPLSTTCSASAHRFTSCVKCSSLTHTQCLPSPSPSSSFLCPPCSQPNFTFFPVPGSPLDEKFARVLLCASKIASASMNKHVAIAKARAERACQVSAAARKRAKEALVHLDALKRCHDRLDGGSLEVSGSKSMELGTVTNNKKEDFNDFLRGQPQPQPQPQNGPVAVDNRNGTNENDGRGGNRERGCNGSTFDAASKP